MLVGIPLAGLTQQHGSKRGCMLLKDSKEEMSRCVNQGDAVKVVLTDGEFMRNIPVASTLNRDKTAMVDLGAPRTWDLHAPYATTGKRQATRSYCSHERI